MAESKENDKFDLGVKGLTSTSCIKLIFFPDKSFENVLIIIPNT